MTAPDIQTSTREERLAFVQDQWQCLNHCPSCGKCSILKGRDAEELYAEYIDGSKSYMEITKEIRGFVLYQNKVAQSRDGNAIGKNLFS